MFPKAKGTVTVAFLVVAALLMGACGPSEARPSQEVAGGEKETPKQGGTYVRSAGGRSYAGLDPAMGQLSQFAWPFIGLMMLKYEPESWNLVGDGIESWEYSKNGLELTLKVRQGIKYPNVPPVNGREVEARDVVYSLKSITGQLYPDLPAVRFPRRAPLEQMVDAVAMDKHTVKVTLSQPSSTFLSGLAEYRAAVILPERLREHFGDIQSLAAPTVERYISAGPFRLSKFTPDTEAVYERNPDYWKKGRPYLDSIREIWLADVATETAAFIANQIDEAGSGTIAEMGFIHTAKKDAVIAGYATSGGFSHIAFNVKKKPFDDVRVRRAFALAVNRKQVGDTVIGVWQGKPLWLPAGPLAPAWPEALSQEELLANPLYKGPTPENVAEAKRLLKEAGYEGGFSTELLTHRPIMGDIVQILEADWRKHLGVNIKLDIVDQSVVLERSAKGNFDLRYWGYIADTSAVAAMKTPYHSKGGRNAAGYSSQKMDQLLDQAAAELDDKKRKALLREAQLLALEDLPYIPSYSGLGPVTTQPWVRGMRIGPATDKRAWMEEVWFAYPPKR